MQERRFIMAFFGRNNNKNGGRASEKAEDCPIKILGSGCARCNALEMNTRLALRQLGMKDAIGHVTDFKEIAAYGVMSTPALVVDGKLASYGRVLSPEDVAKILHKMRG